MNKYCKNEERCDKTQEVLYDQKAIKEKSFDNPVQIITFKKIKSIKL